MAGIVSFCSGNVLLVCSAAGSEEWFEPKYKSLRSYADKYQPDKIYRTSPRNFTRDNDFINIPLYGAFSLAGEKL